MGAVLGAGGARGAKPGASSAEQTSHEHPDRAWMAKCPLAHSPGREGPPASASPLGLAQGTDSSLCPLLHPRTTTQDGYLAFSRPCVASTESSIYVPAAGVLAAAGAAPLQVGPWGGRALFAVPLAVL